MLQHTDPIFSHSKGRWPPETSLWHNSTGRNNAWAPRPVPASGRGWVLPCPSKEQPNGREWLGIPRPHVVVTAMVTRSLCDPALQVAEEEELGPVGQRGAPKLWDQGLASASQDSVPLGCPIQG